VAKVRVNPAAVAEYEDFIKKVNAGRVKLGRPEQVYAWQVALGGSPFEYHFVLPFNGWDEIDALPGPAEIVTKAYGEAEAAKLLKIWRGAIAEVTLEAHRLRLDLSTNAKLGGPTPKFVSITRTEHDRDTAGAYLRLLAKVKKAEEQDANAFPVFRYVQTYGSGEGLVTFAVRPFDKHVERAKWPNQAQVLRKAYGEAEQLEMSEAFTKSIVKRSVVVFAYRPDLSRVSATASSN
jgi:hypothetical protein